MSPVPTSLSWAPGHLMFIDRSTPPPEKSARYRAIMLDCRESLNQPDNANTIRALSDAHNVWHFIETVYLTDSATEARHVSEFLAEWYLVNYPTAQNDMTKSVRSFEGEQLVDDNQQFWRLLIKLAIVGEVDKVRELFSIGKREDQLDEGNSFQTRDKILAQSARGDMGTVGDPDSIVSIVRRIIDCAPDLNISSRTDGSWEEWQASCRMWSEAEELENNEGARLLLGLLGGNAEQIAEACSSWEEMLVACATYGQYGHIVGGHLRGGATLVANSCASASASYKAPDKIAGGALVEAALGNLSNSIVRMDINLPSSWFSAHLCDLLVKSGLIEDISVDKASVGARPVGMREFYFKAYARGLERYRGCWRIAVDYYTACPSQGPAFLLDMLSRVPFETPSDPTAEKVLHVCRRKRYHRTARTICERLGAECLSQQNLGGAMSWFAREGLLKRAQHVAELSLSRAEREGADSKGARSLECVVSAIRNAGDEEMRESFDYLRIYGSMQSSLLSIATARSEGGTTSCAEHISRFVESARRLVGGGLPRRYWIVVTYEAARVLELYPEATSVLSKRAISELLGALQLASGPHRSLDLLAGLRGRLATDSNAGLANSTSLAPIAEAQSALQHCRSVFVQCSSIRINGE